MRLTISTITQALVLILLGACSSIDYSDIVNAETQKSEHSLKMQFIGNITGFGKKIYFDNNLQTRATNATWSNGDKVYIAFYKNSTIIPGEATYNSSEGWSVNYDEELPVGINLRCEVRHFVNASFTSSSLISLNSNSEIYEDTSATYSFCNDSLTVTATLSPKTGRIRFTGKSGETIHTTGISFYTVFYPTTCSFSTSKAMITSIVSSNGSTPYIYGSFADNDCSLGLVGPDYAFTRTCTSNMLKVGESGYMSIPSESSHDEWRSGLYVKASGVEFKMIPIVGHSSGLFLMAETETTEALYNSVKGTTPISQLPKDAVSYPSITAFMETMKEETGLNFSLPSAEQWKYAAQGGNKTHNYTYAGSNTPDDVAWYSANCSSKQTVKTKAPNELGIYDMSGNVGEFVSTLAQGYYPYICGGGYCSKESSIETGSKVEPAHNNSGYSDNAGYPDFGYLSTQTNFGSTACWSRGVGFRLILTCE